MLGSAGTLQGQNDFIGNQEQTLNATTAAEEGEEQGGEKEGRGRKGGAGVGGGGEEALQAARLNIKTTSAWLEEPQGNFGDLRQCQAESPCGHAHRSALT